MSRKMIPLLLMLIAGAVTCVVTFLRDDPVIVKMTALLAVMLLFYFMGSVLKWALNYFEQQNMPKEDEIPTEDDQSAEPTEE
jgi:Ca2+/Na+ antiporter